MTWVSELDQDFIRSNWKGLREVGDDLFGYETVWADGGDTGRWHSTESVVTLNPQGKAIQWYWRAGLTEYQDHEFGMVHGRYVERRTRTIEQVYWV